MLLLVIGLALILLGTMLLILPEKRTREEGYNRGDEKAERIKGGAVVMIGPIPIVVGSDSRTALLMMLVALAIMILWTLVIKGG
ncbi:MAG TPA: DUF131 domain-containing protein [Methanotrichaceae archaeon]|nr:DUF131 domain-containing protein [Methanotrichaceae archaeon]